MKDRETSIKRISTFAFLLCDANDAETTDFSFINEIFCNQCHFLHDLSFANINWYLCDIRLDKLVLF